MRLDPLTVAEGYRLGMEDAMRISAVRQMYTSHEARFDAAYLRQDLPKIFALEPEIADPLSALAEAEATEIKDLEEIANLEKVRMSGPDSGGARPPALIVTDSDLARMTPITLKKIKMAARQKEKQYNEDSDGLDPGSRARLAELRASQEVREKQRQLQAERIRDFL